MACPRSPDSRREPDKKQQKNTERGRPRTSNLFSSKETEKATVTEVLSGPGRKQPECRCPPPPCTPRADRRRGRAGRALTMFHEHVAGRPAVPGGLLLARYLDEVQGRQARPPLVPKNFSRLLPHKVRIGAPFQKRVRGLSEWPVSSGGQRPTAHVGFHMPRAPGGQSRRDTVSPLCKQGGRLRSPFVDPQSLQRPPKVAWLVSVSFTG